MFTERQQKLIRLLEKDMTFQKISDLSKKLGCSQRTIYNEIESLREKNISIISKRGVGIKLNKEVDEKFSLDSTSIMSTRRLEIIKSLFIENKTVTLKKLSENYLVSQTSIKSDIEAIEEILDDGCGAFLKKGNSGTKLDNISLERKINLLTKINQYIITKFSSVSESNHMDNIILYDFYSESLTKVSNNIVYSFFRKNISAIPDTYLDNFSHFFLALLSQLNEGKHITNSVYFLDTSRHAFYIGSATSLLHKASLRLKLTYTNEDVQYLSQMLVNYRIEQSMDKVDLDVVNVVVDEISDVMGIDFSIDLTLKKQLENHIPAMMFRLKYGTIVRNPFLEQIKIDFSILFNSIWIAMENVSSQLGVTFNDDEIAFLTLYFQLSIEKMGDIRKILVVCSTGIVTSELLINRIKKLAPSLDEIEVSSLEEFYELKESKYDLILSTIPLSGGTDRVRYVSAFTPNDELIKILHSTVKRHKKNRSRNDTIRNIYSHVMLEKKFNNKDILLETVSAHLLENNLISDGFLDSIKEREKLGSTELPLGVAIPHGSPECVKESFIVIVQNSRKIKWSSHFVDIVFVIGISKKDMKKTKQVISRIYNMINDDNQLIGLKKEKSEREVLKYLYGEK